MPAQSHQAQVQRSNECHRILRHSPPPIVPTRRAAGEPMPARIGQNEIKVALPCPRHFAPAQPIVGKAMQQHQRRLLSRACPVIMKTHIIELQITFGPGCHESSFSPQIGMILFYHLSPGYLNAGKAGIRVCSSGRAKVASMRAWTRLLPSHSVQHSVLVPGMANSNDQRDETSMFSFLFFPGVERPEYCRLLQRSRSFAPSVCPL